jgi:pectate lyase
MHYRIMSKRSARSYWLITGLVLQSALVGCAKDDSSGLLGSGVGGAANPDPGNGGSTANVQGGGNGVGGATVTSSGGSQSGGVANGGTSSSGVGGSATTGGSVAVGGASTATGGKSTSGGSSAGGDATGGKVASGGSSVGGAATGGKGTTGGAATVGGSSVGGAATGGKAVTGGAATTATGGASTATGGKAATGGASTSTTVGTGPAETKAVGYGQNATGGGNVTATNVSSLAAAQAAVDAYAGTGGLLLNYTGTFNFASITDPCTMRTATAEILEIKNKSNITLIGASGSSAHFGIHIAADSHNIIVRNMTFGLLAGGDYSDMISIEGMSAGIPSDIWIDHNTMFTSLTECDGAGDLEFDGMVDVKKGANNITVSYNYMHDHHKATLNGFSDSDTEVRYITYHHNLFENIGSRTPLQRAGYSHMLNNYFLNVTVTGINVRMGGISLVEANYFENVKNPVTARDSDAIGYWDLRNNNLVTKADVSAGNAFGITWGSVTSPDVNATEWVTTKAYPAVSYSYTAQPFQCVHDGLRATVGAGKGLVTLKCN